MGLLPSGLLDDGDDDSAPAQQDLCRLYTHTLHRREPVPNQAIRIKHAYELQLASEWSMPRTFDRDDTVGGRHNHIFAHVPAMDLNEAVGRSIARIKHPAVPPEITETAWACAHSAFPWGTNRINICHRAACPCGSGAPETVYHTFHECKRSSRVWEMTFKQWRSITGENKVVASNAACTLLGDRSMTWACKKGVHKTRNPRSDLSPLKKVRALSQWNMASLMRLGLVPRRQSDGVTDFSRF